MANGCLDAEASDPVGLFLSVPSGPQSHRMQMPETRMKQSELQRALADYRRLGEVRKL